MSDKLPNQDIFAENLIDSVNVIWDERRVPHIFANNEHDLYIKIKRVINNFFKLLLIITKLIFLKKVFPLFK